MSPLHVPEVQNTAPPLVDQAQALDVYLRSLLSEQPLPVEAPACVAVAQQVPVKAEEPPSALTDGPFQVLLFSVAGLTLAVPLAELHGVLTWSKGITPLPGHAPFFLGVRVHLGCNVKVIDTGALIAPRQRRPEEMNLRHIILIGGGEWGLACEDIGEVITLRAQDVRWRSARTERPWLVGTVTAHLSALLDTQAFATELAQGLPGR
ncbi:MAG: chemotaxis protein CheW [Gammaproteobacteria bacterium]|nr:chemotaxis protein CheW [Gammaproteobacteria bacterium]